MLEIYIDGATKGHPGDSGIGFLIKNNQERIEGYAYIGESTNHEAEFNALIYVLDYCQEHFQNEILSVRSDSKLVVDLVNRGCYKKDPYKSLVIEVNKKSEAFPHFFIKWIPEQENKHADRLARHAIHAKDKQINRSPSL